MMNVKFTVGKMNVQVLAWAGEKREILDNIRNRKWRWIGHVLRRDGLLRTVMEEKFEEKEAD